MGRNTRYLIYVDPPVRRTAAVVKFLISCRDQVASTVEVADGICCATQTAREALRLLQQTGRVDEIRPDWWHLE